MQRATNLPRFASLMRTRLIAGFGRMEPIMTSTNRFYPAHAPSGLPFFSLVLSGVWFFGAADAFRCRYWGALGAPSGAACGYERDFFRKAEQFRGASSWLRTWRPHVRVVPGAPPSESGSGQLNRGRLSSNPGVGGSNPSRRASSSTAQWLLANQRVAKRRGQRDQFSSFKPWNRRKSFRFAVTKTRSLTRAMAAICPSAADGGRPRFARRARSRACQEAAASS